jgi:hypothetical protein
LPQIERRRYLEAIVSPASTDTICYSRIEGRGEELLRRFSSLGLEGVTSKQTDAKYVATRGGAWLKMKCLQRQELVVVGWTGSPGAYPLARKERVEILPYATSPSSVRGASVRSDPADPKVGKAFGQR